MESLHLWPVVRSLKFLGLAWFLLGLGGATIASSRYTRLRATYLAMVPGFIVAYATGWLLMKLSGRSLLTPWVLAGSVAGLGGLHLAFMVSHRERPRTVSPALAWGCASTAILVMTVRPTRPSWLLALLVVGLVLGSLGAWPFARMSSAVVTDRGDHAIAWNGLRWLTWLEGASLIFMVLLAMPLRAATGITLDGGTGLIGWTHGVFVLVFVQALSSTRGLFGWPRKEWMVGVLSSLIPGMSFWFEWHLRRRRLNAGAATDTHVVD